MDIWIFNHYATAPSHVGGTRHYDLASYLVGMGHKVTIFASSFNHFLKKETISYKGFSCYEMQTINGVNYVWLRTTKYKKSMKRLINIIDYTFKANKIAKRMLKHGKPDIIIGSSVHPLAAYIGHRISKKSASVFYFEERDLWPQTFVDFNLISKNNLITKALYKFESFLYGSSRRIIVLFDRAPDYVVSKGIEPSKAIYLPNGVNTDNYHDFSGNVDLAAKIEKYPQRVIYTGSIGLANNLEPLIETANIIQNDMRKNDIHFFVVGSGPVKIKLIKIAKKYNLSNITFMDPVPKTEIPFLLSLADLSFISIKESPLYKWGFSMNKLYDYMAAGLPVMMYSSKEVIGDLRNLYGINLAEDPKKLAIQITEKINNQQYKKSAGDFLKNYVEKNYSWTRLANKLERYMKEDLVQGEKPNEKDI